MVALGFRALYALFPLLSLLQVFVSADTINDLEAKGRPAMYAALSNSTTCTKQKLKIRREWGDLSISDKLSYIAAVKCLINSPSRFNSTHYPGAKSRFDDFIIVHMKQTPYIHNTGNFLTWHRYFTAAYEYALRKECHYNGMQPYWHWGRWAQNPQKSPLFDGSATSMGGQGEHVPHNNTFLGFAGAGGGCIASGPFKGMMINLGPRSITQTPPPTPNPRADGYGYNPRCVKRDITNVLTSRDATTDKIADLMTNYTTIESFQDKMQGPNSVHSAGHFTYAGDPGGDFYTSPGDVAFYFHHAMVDRVYSGWQALDFAHRQQVIAGGTEMFNQNSTRATLDDIVDLEAVNIEGKAYKIKELVSTVEGPFCYMYE